MQISACIPCRNSAATIRESIASVRAQSTPVSEILVVDDASQDDSAAIAEAVGAKVFRLSTCQGRGAVRAIGMERTVHELVLFVDSSKALHPEFLERALPWFTDPAVAAVCGRVNQGPHRTAADRWCGRHIFRETTQLAVTHRASLITAGAVIRRDMVMRAGGFDRKLTYAEDRDLGERLLQGGLDVIFDPELVVTNLTTNNLENALERYWRWNWSPSDRLSTRAIGRMLVYSLKVLAYEDFTQGDFLSIPISIISPHYLFLEMLTNTFTQKPWFPRQPD